MSKTYANLDVLSFYKELPFNYYGSIETSAENIKKRNSIEYHTVLPPLLKNQFKVIDVGCGCGSFVNAINYYYRKYGTSAIGIDYNTVALKQAREVASILDIASEFVETDLFNYRPKLLFDLVTSIGVLHHTDNCIEALRCICKYYVANGGYIFIGLYHEYGRKPFLNHFNDLKLNGASEKTLMKEFKKLFRGYTDETHFASWFFDQVMHPHETQHTLEKLIPVLHSENMELISTSINKFEPFDSENEICEVEKTLLILECKD